MSPAPVLVYLGLGSNLGDRAEHLRCAVAALAADDAIEVTAVSGIHETTPVGEIAQPHFLNAVVELRTSLAPRALLTRCQAIERSRGRDRSDGNRWGPRTVDLDVLLYGTRTVREPGLVIPHPRLHERLFVLVPLAEIAPGVVHPGSGRSIESLVETLRGECDAGRACS